MRRHSALRARAWMLVLGAFILIAGHGIILYYVTSHVALSGTVVSGAIILIVIKHLGLLAPVYALFRRRRRNVSVDNDTE